MEKVTPGKCLHCGKRTGLNKRFVLAKVYKKYCTPYCGMKYNWKVKGYPVEDYSAKHYKTIQKALKLFYDVEQGRLKVVKA